MRIDKFPPLLLSYPVLSSISLIIQNTNVNMRSSIFFFFLKETIQAYLGNITGSVPDPHNKANIKTNQVK